MSKFKLFIENFLVYGLGGIIGKLIPLIMIPIITRIMPSTDYFGISDLSNTVVQFGSYLAIMGMCDGMYRMFFEKSDEEYRRAVCSTTLVFTAIMAVIVFCIMLLCCNPIARVFFGNKKYINVVLLSAIAMLAGSTNSIIAAPTRMQNKRKVFLVTNAIGPLLSYSIALPLLLMGHYVIALPLAAVFSGLIMEVSFWCINKSWFDYRKFDKTLLKKMLMIALPLVPNFLIYWIFNSCDKVMITNLIGIGAAGVYSVGSNMGHASQLIYTAFAGGWQYFAFSTMKEENQVKSNSMIFEYLGVISFVATGFVCAWSYILFKILFSAEYLEGYIVAPYLFLAPLLQMLFQVIANQFLVVKKTWPNLFILISGAAINVVINYFLIPVWGIEGASIATLVGYIVSDIICVIVLCRMQLMVVSKRFGLATIVFLLYMVAWRFLFCDKAILGTFFALVCATIMFLLYRDDCMNLMKLIKEKKNLKSAIECNE